MSALRCLLPLAAALLDPSRRGPVEGLQTDATVAAPASAGLRADPEEQTQQALYRAYRARSASLAAIEKAAQDKDKKHVSMTVSTPGSGAASESESLPTTIAWVLGTGRSGSSLLMHLVAEAAKGSRVFVAFEPCHPEDQYQGSVLGEEDTFAPTRKCLQDVLKCNFGPLSLGEGPNARTRRESGLGPDDDLTAACKASQYMVVKTIDYAYNLEKVKHVLAGEPATAERVRLLDMRRDPRDVYVSRKRLNDEWPGWARPETIEPLCSMLVHNSNVAPDLMRIEHVGYTKLVKKPRVTMNKVLDFLGWPFSPQLESFMQENMGGSKEDCQHQRLIRGPYSLCHSSNKAKYNNWVEFLDAEEAALFEIPTCKRASEIAESEPDDMQVTSIADAGKLM